MSKRRNQTNENMVNSSVAYLKYYNHLMQLAMTMFKWENLPETVDERFLELGLFEKGMMLFFEDKDLAKEKGGHGFVCLNCTIGGQLDIYRNPIVRRAYANNGYNAWRDKTNSVIIYNNYLRQNSILGIRQFAQRLADIELAIDVNCKAQKTPVMILCDENQRLSLENMYMKYEGNYPFIFGEKALNPNSLKAIVTGAPFVADKLYQIKMQIWNEALTELGISNISYQKKERLVSDEVVRNMGGTIASRYSRLEMRRQAAERINKMFGLDISVDFREDFREADDEVMIHGETGEEGKATDQMIDLRTK